MRIIWTRLRGAFGRVVDSKRPPYRGAQRQGGVYTDILAAQMGLSEAAATLAQAGALLHDVGKARVSNAILDKPGKLDDGVGGGACMPPHTEEILSRIGALGRASPGGWAPTMSDFDGISQGLKGGDRPRRRASSPPPTFSMPSPPSALSGCHPGAQSPSR